MDLFKLKGNLHIWSNLAYLIAGLFMGSTVMMIGMFALAFTSFMGHWKGGKWWIADWVGMYLAFTSVIFVHLGIPLLWLLFAPVIAWATYKYHKTSFVRIGIVGALAVLSAYLAGINVLPAIITFGVAFGIRQLTPNMDDKYYDICHSIWHILTATGRWMLGTR
jgi:hypothetical protein